MTEEQLKQGNIIIRKIDYLQNKYILLCNTNKECPIRLDTVKEYDGANNIEINRATVEFQKELIAKRIGELRKELEAI